MAAGRAGAHFQGCHGKLPVVPHTCAGLPPTLLGTSSQADLLAMSLMLDSVSFIHWVDLKLLPTTLYTSWL